VNNLIPERQQKSTPLAELFMIRVNERICVVSYPVAPGAWRVGISARNGAKVIFD
jgi:hypothetical protein